MPRPFERRQETCIREAMNRSIIVWAAASLGASAVPAGDLANGRAKSAQCVACHGLEGIAPNPTFPHLAGQNAAYVQMQLESFRAGERYHPLMTPVAQSLSDEDMGDLATYFSSLGALSAGSR